MPVACGVPKEKVYGAVPPFAVTVAVPFVPPLQLALVVAVSEAVSTAGFGRLTVVVNSQPLLSLTLTEWLLPPQRPVAVWVVWLLADQRKVYGAVPPDGNTVAAPLQPLLQLTCCVTLAVADTVVDGCVIVAQTKVWQKLRSEIVTQ